MLFLGVAVSANHTQFQGNDTTVKKNIEKIKQLLASKDWVVADTSIERQLLALISYLENPPVDSVVTTLDQMLDNKVILFARDYQRIKNPETVKGYVPQPEISQKLKEISTDISNTYPLNSIVVPLEEFESGYASLGLIDEEEIGRLVIDSLYTFPDSIMAIINDQATDENEPLRCWLDSVCTQLLNDALLAYNDSLLTTFRDSVTQHYRDNYLQSLINARQNHYLDSVYSINNHILARYNDSETLRLNQELKEELQALVDYVREEPKELTIFNLKNEKSTFLLQHGGDWKQWMYLKNSQNDSIGIRVENLNKNSIRMLVDESVNLSRLTIKDGFEVNKITPLTMNEQILSKFSTRNPVLSPWKLVGKAYAGFTQTYINQFWSQGGKSSASALSTFNYMANYSKNKVKWENVADFKLGVIYYLSDNENANRNWHKSSDNVELNSRFGLSASKKWYYSAEANFKTQSFYGFSNQNDTIPSSAFLSPGYLTFSAGMEYKPGKEFSAFLSPIALKTTYVTNPLVNETKFGLLEGETHKSRIGMSGKIDYSKSIFENVALKTKNSIFINFGNSSAGEWQVLKLPDFDSETSIDFKVNQFITTQVNFHLIYDKDVESTWASASGEQLTGTRLQVKEFFTLGISYKF
jgi:hypothetical protein